jgi:hypothetical protein
MASPVNSTISLHTLTGYIIDDRRSTQFRLENILEDLLGIVVA